jgi:transposase
MAKPQKQPLRLLSKQEEQELQRLVKMSSERVDVVRRAKVLLAVADGQSWTEAAHQAGLKSGDGVGKLVARFNERGLAALTIAPGQGRKPTYTSQDRAFITALVQRPPDREEDQTITWSLTTLRRALRKKQLPHIANETIREVLHESGYSYQRTGTKVGVWGVCKSRIVTVPDQETPKKS